MKNKVAILDTAYATENGLAQGVKNALRYLVDNRQVTLSPMDLQTIYSTKLYSTSPTNTIFAHLLAEGLMDEFALIDTTLSSQSTPELLTITDITVDMKQCATASMVFASLKEYRNKVIVNIAPLLQRTREGIIRLTDVNELHNQIVRGALVSSYYNTTGSMWLNPNLLKYICQTYSMCISSNLQRIYQLDLPSQMTIATALTWFMMHRMTDDADELTSQCDYLGSKLQIRQTLEMFKETIDDPHTFSLTKLANLIAVCGPDHMKGFNRDILIRAVARHGSSHICMCMALEYPPYWVHQLLYALSGNKVALNVILQKNKLLKSAGQFLQDLDTSRQFIPSVAFVTKGMSSFEGHGYSAKECGFVTDNYIHTVLEAISADDTPTIEQIEASKHVDMHTADTILDSSEIMYQLSKHGAPQIKDGLDIKDYFTLKSARIARDGAIYFQWIYAYEDFTCEIVDKEYIYEDDHSIRVYMQTWPNIPGTESYLDIFGSH